MTRVLGPPCHGPEEPGRVRWTSTPLPTNRVHDGVPCSRGSSEEAVGTVRVTQLSTAGADRARRPQRHPMTGKPTCVPRLLPGLSQACPAGSVDEGKQNDPAKPGLPGRCSPSSPRPLPERWPPSTGKVCRRHGRPTCRLRPSSGRHQGTSLPACSRGPVLSRASAGGRQQCPPALSN